MKKKMVMVAAMPESMGKNRAGVERNRMKPGSENAGAEPVVGQSARMRRRS